MCTASGTPLLPYVQCEPYYIMTMTVNQVTTTSGANSTCHVLNLKEHDFLVVFFAVLLNGI